MTALTDEAREKCARLLAEANSDFEGAEPIWYPYLEDVDAIAPILLAAGAADMQERAAQVVMDNHEPWAIMALGGTEFDMTKVLADSPLQMMGRRAAAIRALPTTPEEGNE